MGNNALIGGLLGFVYCLFCFLGPCGESWRLKCGFLHIFFVGGCHRFECGTGLESTLLKWVELDKKAWG